MKTLVKLTVALFILSLASHARAESPRERQAKELYVEGKAAYEARDFQHAYDSFKRAYLISQKPELLFNMASALQGLERPHDAAEALRAYLRQVPEDPDRAAIERRIQTLEEAQRILDGDSARKAATPVVQAPAPVTLVAPAPERVAVRHSRKFGILLGTTLGVMAVGLAVGLGVGLSSTTEPASSVTVGPITATR